MVNYVKMYNYNMFPHQVITNIQNPVFTVTTEHVHWYFGNERLIKISKQE